MESEKNAALSFSPNLWRQRSFLGRFVMCPVADTDGTTCDSYPPPIRCLGRNVSPSISKFVAYHEMIISSELTMIGQSVLRVISSLLSYFANSVGDPHQSGKARYPTQRKRKRRWEFHTFGCSACCTTRPYVTLCGEWGGGATLLVSLLFSSFFLFFFFNIFSLVTSNFVFRNCARALICLKLFPHNQ